jgi:hypothetical protein
VNKLVTRLAVPGRLSAARPAERRRCSFLHLLWRAMHRIDKSSKHGRGRAMGKWKCPLRCQQGWQCAVLMAWTGRHNSNSACAHSQTGVRQSDCYAQVSNVAGIDGGLPIKVGNEAVPSQLPALPATKNRKVGANAGILGKRQGLQRPFECGVARSFLPSVQKIDVCYRRPQQKWRSLP